MKHKEMRGGGSGGGEWQQKFECFFIRTFFDSLNSHDENSVALIGFFTSMGMFQTAYQRHFQQVSHQPPSPSLFHPLTLITSDQSGAHRKNP
jgi:hypothetical protein